MTINQLRAAVRLLRLERGWTYQQLADEIGRVNGSATISTDALRRFILAEHNPRETHEYAIRSYMERSEFLAATTGAAAAVR